MDIAALQSEIDEVSVILYQNREQEALRAAGELFGKLKIITDALICGKAGENQEIVLYVSAMYQTLYAAYERKDMLGIADCLQEYAMLATELYREMIGG